MINSVFVAWGRIGRRTRELSKAINAKLLFIYDKPPYIHAWLKTGILLMKYKPKVTIIQLPQGPLLYKTIELKKRLKYTLIADVHTGFIMHDAWKNLVLNKPFNFLLKYCDLIITHNEPLREYLIKYKKISKSKIIIVHDPFPQIPKKLVEPRNLNIKSYEYIVFPASWNPDENIKYIVSEYLSSKISNHYKLVITGDYNRNKKLARIIEERGRGRVILTHYRPINEYYWILNNSLLIITGTTREYTMLSSIWEAVALRKPFVVSWTKTIYSIIGKFAFYYTYKKGSLKELLDTCLGNTFYFENLSKKVNTLYDRLSSLSKESINKLNIIIKSVI